VIPRDEPLGSFLTRSNLNLQMQRFTRRSLFTLDLSGGRTYYWDKDEDPIDYNASISASYLHRLLPGSRPPYFSTPPTFPSRICPGSIRPTARPAATSSIRWHVRTFPIGSLRAFRQVATASYAGNRYTEKVEEVGNYDQWTLGIEARYLWKPRWTLLAEVRHSMTTYDQQPTSTRRPSIFWSGPNSSSIRA
jgi:hypothetical protein